MPIPVLDAYSSDSDTCRAPIGRRNFGCPRLVPSTPLPPSPVAVVDARDPASREASSEKILRASPVDSGHLIDSPADGNGVVGAPRRRRRKRGKKDKCVLKDDGGVACAADFVGAEGAEGDGERLPVGAAPVGA